jgi:UDP:flavonoid glycosyltransferase YjiC (YdhE family)
MVVTGWQVAHEMGVPSVMTALQPFDAAFPWAPLRRLKKERYPILYGFSPALYPRSPDWGDWVEMTGYWFLDRLPGWAPPPDLVDFLDAGPPPVAVGFGSIPEDSAGSLTELTLEALERAGQRGVLLAGAGGLGSADLPSWAHMIDEVPYDWLFPRMTAVVYHGGLGTMAEALRAGVPMACIPYHAEQFLWASRLEDLGAGPPMVPRSELSVEALSSAIDTASTDRRIRRRAAELGAVIATEDGVDTAVAAFERHVKGFEPRGAGVPGRSGLGRTDPLLARETVQ